MTAVRKSRTAEQLRKLTDRQLFSLQDRLGRERAMDELRPVLAEVHRRGKATDYGRNPEWEGQNNLKGIKVTPQLIETLRKLRAVQS
jgi:hypothetical protein